MYTRKKKNLFKKYQFWIEKYIHTVVFKEYYNDINLMRAAANIRKHYLYMEMTGGNVNNRLQADWIIKYENISNGI